MYSQFGGGGDSVGDHDKMVENGNNIFDLFPFVIIGVDGKEAGVIIKETRFVYRDVLDDSRPLAVVR